MKIANPTPEVLAAALAGKLGAIEALLACVQPGVFALAVRMLGNRDDAADATQEILLRIVTHLGSFRGDAAFSTWVYQVARNQLLTAATRSREHPEVSLEGMQARLGEGLAFADALARSAPPDAASAHHAARQTPNPEDAAAARELAVSCTQSMLMALDREQRLAYLLDVLLGLDSEQAAAVLDITPAAYRKRLQRARDALQTHMGGTCGYMNADAPCRCDKQLPARRAHPPAAQFIPLKLVDAERPAVAAHFEQLKRLGDAMAVFRGFPAFAVPEQLVANIRTLLTVGPLAAD
ncbi:hypothetical protein IP84_06735 [beta proteobacterium AAP99]|nr:hypothetical protein IP84_06735 [beta proteobacterium AAP99]